MKKLWTMALSALLAVCLLAGCGGNGGSGSGGNSGGSPAAETTVDLSAFYQELASEYGWDDNYMVDIEGDMLESYYPGLSDIETKQFIAKNPIMSAVVNELVFVQCADDAAAGNVAAMLKERVDMQAEGGAWYPESMEAWAKGSVIQKGSYVALIASAEYQEEIEGKFNALFAA